jgi:hypothetical protein
MVIDAQVLRKQILQLIHQSIAPLFIWAVSHASPLPTTYLSG